MIGLGVWTCATAVVTAIAVADAKPVDNVHNFTGIVDYPVIIEQCEPSLISSGYTQEYYEEDLGYDPEEFVSLVEQGMFASALVYEYTGKLEIPVEDDPDMFWLTKRLRSQDPEKNDCLYLAISEQPTWRDVWKPHVQQIAFEEGTSGLRMRVRMMRRIERFLGLFGGNRD